MPLRHLIASLAAILALLISGCASVQPTPEQMQAEIASYQLPRQPEAGTALVYVVFPEEWSGLQFDVYLNGQGPQSAIGYNRGGQYLCFSVQPGQHKIYSREDGNTSTGRGWTEFALSAKAGDIIFLRQEMIMGWVNVENRLVLLPPDEGRYYIKASKAGTLQQGASQTAQPAAPVVPTVSAAGADTFMGTVVGGNFAKGVGFSNLNVKLIVRSEKGEDVVFFVRSDSRVFDASGKQMDYLEASRILRKQVSIEHFVIRDGSGGQPGRSDFAYEIGEKGVRTLRLLAQ